jgi:hypothetical protein
MKSDAKLGLIAGIVGVLTVAVVYYHKPTTALKANTVATSKSTADRPTSPLAAVSIPSPIPRAKPDNSNSDLD